MSHIKTTKHIIALGASTGGTEAIKEVLMRLPAETPGMVITQHLPEAFSGPFARRMDHLVAMTVCEAQDGQLILPGHVYIAPGNRHLLVRCDNTRYVCQLHDGPPVNRHRPSVDVLFRSVAQSLGAQAIGVLLTGMGDDGARGLKEMHEAGAYTLVQDEKTSVVWGMPGQAVKIGAVDAILPLADMAEKILTLSVGQGRMCDDFYLDADIQAPWDPDFSSSFGYDDWHPYTLSQVYANYEGNRLRHPKQATAFHGASAPLAGAVFKREFYDLSFLELLTLQRHLELTSS